LKLQCDDLLSNLAFNFNLRQCSKDSENDDGARLLSPPDGVELMFETLEHATFFTAPPQEREQKQVDDTRVQSSGGAAVGGGGGSVSDMKRVNSTGFLSRVSSASDFLFGSGGYGGGGGGESEGDAAAAAGTSVTSTPTPLPRTSEATAETETAAAAAAAVAAVPMRGGGAALFRVSRDAKTGKHGGAMIARLAPPPPLPSPIAKTRKTRGQAPAFTYGNSSDAAAAAAAAGTADNMDEEEDTDDEEQDEDGSEDGSELDGSDSGDMLSGGDGSFECMCALPGGGVARVWGDNFRGAHVDIFATAGRVDIFAAVSKKVVSPDATLSIATPWVVDKSAAEINSGGAWSLFPQLLRIVHLYISAAVDLLSILDSMLIACLCISAAAASPNLSKLETELVHDPAPGHAWVRQSQREQRRGDVFRVRRRWQGLADGARHVIGCHFTLRTRGRNMRWMTCSSQYLAGPRRWRVCSLVHRRRPPRR